MSPFREFDYQLYELLVAELRYLHTAWINNFRVILTFNSLLLPGSFAIFVVISRGVIPHNGLRASALLLASLSLAGILVTAVGLLILRRIKAIASLRLQQVRRLELRLSGTISVSPFHEGYALFGGSPDSTVIRTLGDSYLAPDTLKLSGINGYWGYVVISTGFGAAYLLLLLLTIFGP